MQTRLRAVVQDIDIQSLGISFLRFDATNHNDIKPGLRARHSGLFSTLAHQGRRIAMNKKWFLQSIKGLIVGLFLLTRVGHAEEFFPAQVTNSRGQLKLCSQAELKAFRLIHVGRAALFLENCNNIKDIFSVTPKRLRFLYEKSIPAKAFREASYEYLKINLGQKFTLWKASYDQFNNNYQDIKAGDYYDLIYDPLTGLLLQLNGKNLATIKEPDIALAYLNVWFGNEPFSEDLKKTLLKLND